MSAGRDILITGGAGFIGVNAADHFARQGDQVTLFDNLSRSGTERNLEWVTAAHPEAVRFVRGDVRDPDALKAEVAGRSAVIHLAAQVAVTTSLTEPATDFGINAQGTFNLLEAVRLEAADAPVLFASTNKVYGALEDWELEPTATRWMPAADTAGVPESQPLDFHSPYGCSKGAADQYVRDYARCFGLKTVVFRQSCVYGAHQYGNEDQGWVAHFVHSLVAGRPITIYGDGRQVRDLLDVRDLCRLYELALDGIDRCTGQVFNIGGGHGNTRSVLEVVLDIERLLESDAHYSFSDWRQGDQPYYVSDLTWAREVLGWAPSVPFAQGLDDLVEWARGFHAVPAGRG